MSNKFNEDFKEFMSSEGVAPPNELSEKILNHVRKDLDPSHITVFSKLLGVQAFIGILTMLFCPQFSLSLTNNHDVYHYFHYTFGESICMAICGSIFIGSGAVFASFLLNSGEIRKISQSKYLYYFSICSLSVLAFMLLGVETYLKLTAFWVLGAFCSGLILFELGKLINSRLRFLMN